MDGMQSNSPNKHDEHVAEQKTDRDTPPAGMRKRSASSADESPTRGSAKKRAIDDDEFGEDGDIDPAKLATMSRSERKRYREKKRRSDVNKGFDDLMNLLIEIDPAVRAEAEERARRGQWKGSLGAQEDNLLSRVDLIGRTVKVLRRLHQENEQRKVIIGQLVQASQQARADLGPAQDEAALMAPLLATVSENSMASQLAAARSQLLQQQQQSALTQLSFADARAAEGFLGQSSYGSVAASLPLQSTNSDLLLGLGGSGLSGLSGRLAGAASLRGLGLGQHPVNADQLLATRNYLQLLREQQASAAQLRGLLGDPGSPSSAAGLPPDRRR